MIFASQLKKSEVVSNELPVTTNGPLAVDLRFHAVEIFVLLFGPIKFLLEICMRLAEVCLNLTRKCLNIAVALTFLTWTTMIPLHRAFAEDPPSQKHGLPQEVLDAAIENISEEESAEIFRGIAGQEGDGAGGVALGEMTLGVAFAVGIAASLISAAVWAVVAWGDHYQEEGAEILEAARENAHIEGNQTQFDTEEQAEQEANLQEHVREYNAGFTQQERAREAGERIQERQAAGEAGVNQAQAQAGGCTKLTPDQLAIAKKSNAHIVDECYLQHEAFEKVLDY